MNGSLKYVGYALLVLLLGAWLRAGWIWCYPYEPITIHSISILDSDNVVTSGDTIYYETVYTKRMPIVATVTRWLVNSYVVPITAYSGQVPLGKGKSINPVLVPDFVSSGTYKLVIEYAYSIGSFPTRTIKVQAESGPFVVVKNRDYQVGQQVEEINRKMLENTEAIRGIKEKVKKDEAVLKRHRTRSTYDPAEN